MPMCRRTSGDPLVRYFLDRYGLNLLAIPRVDVSVATLYVSSDGRRVSMPGAIERFLTPRPPLPKIRKAEPMADLAGTTSDAVQSRAGLGLLEGFLIALSGAGIVDNVKAEYQRKRVRSLRFRITAATRDSVDPVALGDSLQGCHLRKDHPLWGERNRYYVVAGVVRTSSLVVVAHGASNDAVDIDVGALLTLASASGSIQVERAAEGAIRYRGPQPLAFGVELYELVPDRQMSTLRLRTPDEYVATRSGGVNRVAGRAPIRVFPGGQNGRAFLDEE